MRADVRDPEGNCVVADEEQVDQPCGSASSDSNSNGDVKSPKTPVSSAKIHSAKTTPLSSTKSTPGSTKMCKCGTRKVKASIKQKRQIEAAKAKRKAGGEDPIGVRLLAAEDDDDEVSDDEYIPGPSTSNDLDFGYDPSHSVPWATKNYYPLSIDGLHDEIVDCWQWIRPTRLETATRYKVFERVRDLIQSFWAHVPDVHVSVFGSLRTRLFLPSSDIDVLVECKAWTALTDLQLHNEVMKQTMRFLQQHLDKVSFHSGAFVPILKFSDRDTRLNIDISFNTVQGVKAATYMHQVKNEFPCVEPLLLLLKQYIFQNKLHEAYSGGLSSYGISLMLVNFFTIHYSDYRYRQPEEDGINLGYLLMRFLEVYGHELNYSEVAVDPAYNRYRRRSECIRPTVTTGAATASSEGGEGEGETEEERGGGGGGGGVADVEGTTRPVLLSVHDPLHEGNEVCRASFNIYAVRSLFQSALVQLRAVFVADRPASMVWRKNVYKGTMLGRLLHFSPAQINFRYWLKGFVLSRPEGDTTGNGKAATSGMPTIIYGSILSEPSDLSCLLRIPKAGQRVLEIKRPEDVEEEKKEEGRKKGENNEKNQEEMKPQYEDTVVRQHHQQQREQPWMTVGRGGRVYGGAQAYKRDQRYGGHHKNYYYNHQQQGGHPPVQHLQHQPRPYNGVYHSKTWERMGGGNTRRLYDDKTKSKSTEGLAETLRPRREMTPQPMAGGAPTTATTTTLTYKRSDSAVSSCSTTVMGTTSSFSTASSSVSSPAINGSSAHHPPPGFGHVLRGPSHASSSSPSGSSSYLSRNRDRQSGRGEVYKPPAARKAAEAAAAAGTTTAASAALKKKELNLITKSIEEKSSDPSDENPPTSST